MTEAFLCRLDEIPDGDSNRFVAEVNGIRRGYLAVRQGIKVFVYGNSCPHIGSPLDFLPGKFLNAEKTHIMCSTHGALFRIDDGYCVSGPCAGASLPRCLVEVRGTDVYIRDVSSATAGP